MATVKDLDALHGWLESAQRHEAHLLSLLHDAQAEVNMIKSRCAQLEAQKCPINRVPNELLISIFTFFVQDLDQDDAEAEHKLCHWRPVVLSHVSRQWRILALSTSCLWSRIVLSKASPVSAFDHFITHAGTSLIDIFANDIDDDQSTRHAPLVSSEYLPRSRTIAITTLGPLSMVNFLRSLYDPVIFSHLSTLKLSCDPPHRVWGTFFHGLPSRPDVRFPGLRHVQLVEVPIYSVPIGVFRNIHTLELSNPKQGPYPLTRFHPHLLNVLSAARRLEHLILSDFTPFIDHGTDPIGGGNPLPTIALPLLQEFIWYYPEVRALRHFFSHVSTPRLRNADFSAKSNRGMTQNVTPFAFRFPFVDDLTIECDTQETLYSATREMEFPGIRNLIIQTSIDKWDPTSSLPVFRWSAIFRDLRVPYLTRLTLFRLSITLDHIGGVFQYMPSLRSLTCDMCDGVANLLCALSAGDCACPIGKSIHEDHGLLELESLTFRDCDGLRIGCLQKWICARNGDGESRHTAVNRTQGRSVARRKIKPLSGKYKSRVQRPGPTPTTTSIEKGLEGLSLGRSSTAACYIPNYLRQPSKITFVSFDNCSGIVEANARELQRLGIDTVEWK
ncbi:hypothetical protein BJ322DRAFT_1113729 [Thelephora terrestris]|uniref:F-box domain-containing protein n=1 Tax=Thelephora terrestris TaxID=56493 RepID=A0A9P6L248_9AGAM|nr:hypothetical protein BJ322DRAFT_1113729 [Thelephora terrestris]